MMSPREFTAWLATVPPSSSIVYFTGCLARSRCRWTDRDGEVHQPIPGLDALAKAVTKAVEQGAVIVTQKRIGEGVWEYVAVKSAPPPPPARARLASFGRRNIELGGRP